MADIKTYKRAEVAERSGRGGAPAWIIYKDSVYDVTKYLSEHPGGDDAILGEAGGDASKAFDDIGHSGDARAVLASFKIGEIVEEEKRYDANGKKRKIVAQNVEPKAGGRSFLSVVTCGLLGS